MPGDSSARFRTRRSARFGLVRGRAGSMQRTTRRHSGSSTASTCDGAVQADLDGLMSTVDEAIYDYMQGPSEFTITGTLERYDGTPLLKASRSRPSTPSASLMKRTQQR